MHNLRNLSDFRSNKMEAFASDLDGLINLLARLILI